LVAAGDNPERLRSEAAWAHLCGVAPIEASSGKVTRHRLDRGGNREANAALFRIVLVRISCDPSTKAYLERRIKEGKSKLEVIRILKRYVAREVYRQLPRR
jgi:transposase